MSRIVSSFLGVWKCGTARSLVFDILLLGSRDGAVVLALSHMCAEFVAPGVFLPPQKATFPNSNSTTIEDPHKNQLRLLWLPL